MTRRVPSPWVFAATLLGACSSREATPAPAPDPAICTRPADAALPITSGLPIAIPKDAPYSKWTWVSVPEARCGNDTPTGMAINPSSSSKRLLIHFEGGGACWTKERCGPGGTAANLGGVDEARMMSNVSGPPRPGTHLDRTALQNPFRDYSYVYLPYCTGDLYTGSNVASYGTHHVGYNNVTAFLARILPTFPDVEQVVLYGLSAGGFGVLWNHSRIQDAFGSVPVLVVDDSGPMLPQPYFSAELQAAVTNEWRWDKNVPVGCLDCNASAGFHHVLLYALAKHPASRLSIIASYNDFVVSSLLGIDLQSTQEGLQKLDEIASVHPNFRVFYLEGSGHGHDQDYAVVSQDGVTLSTFLNQEVDCDPGWKSVRPSQN